jgi:hypothetical protein
MFCCNIKASRARNISTGSKEKCSFAKSVPEVALSYKIKREVLHCKINAGSTTTLQDIKKNAYVEEELRIHNIAEKC